MSGLPTVWCEIIEGWDCDKVTGDLVQHDKAKVDASLISVIAVYGNKEERLNYYFAEKHYRFLFQKTLICSRKCISAYTYGTLTDICLTRFKIQYRISTCLSKPENLRLIP